MKVMKKIIKLTLIIALAFTIFAAESNNVEASSCRIGNQIASRHRNGRTARSVQTTNCHSNGRIRRQVIRDYNANGQRIELSLDIFTITIDCKDF